MNLILQGHLIVSPLGRGREIDKFHGEIERQEKKRYNGSRQASPDERKRKTQRTQRTNLAGAVEMHRQSVGFCSFQKKKKGKTS